MNYFENDMRPSDRQANREARFSPAREPHAPQITYAYGTDCEITEASGDETYGPPCTEIGGVQIYTYIRDGILVVSLHYDTAETGPSSPFALYGFGDCVPTVIKAGGSEPVWEALPADAISEADHRQLRKTSSDRPGDWVLPDWIYSE